MKTTSLWVAPLLLWAASTAAQDKVDDEGSVMVTITGVLRTGVVAIGGETTGTTVTARKITFELTFGKNAKLQEAAEKLDGKKVVVQGTLERRRGVEVRERLIVTVTSLREAGKGDKAKADEPEKQSFRATPGRTDTSLRFESEGETTVIDVVSKFGIDKATIRRLGAEWPRTVLVRLHLRGLESFKAGQGGKTVEWSAGAEDGGMRIALRQDGKETQLTKDSPYYTKARIAGDDGKGRPCFEVPLPAKLFEGNPVEITLHWVDFFRE